MDNIQDHKQAMIDGVLDILLTCQVIVLKPEELPVVGSKVMALWDRIDDRQRQEEERHERIVQQERERRRKVD